MRHIAWFILMPLSIYSCSIGHAQQLPDVSPTQYDLMPRSMVFIKSDSEIHFVRGALDPDREKENDIFQFDETTGEETLRKLKAVVEDRRINILPNADVSVELLTKVVRTFAEPKYAIKFITNTGGASVESWPDGVDVAAIKLENKRKKARLQNAFDQELDRLAVNQDSGFKGTNVRYSLRTKLAALFDERQRIQLQKINAQIKELEELRSRIQDRSNRKSEVVDEMLEHFLRETSQSGESTFR